MAWFVNLYDSVNSWLLPFGGFAIAWLIVQGITLYNRHKEIVKLMEKKNENDQIIIKHLEQIEKNTKTGHKFERF